jgi:hypothetical protein
MIELPQVTDPSRPEKLCSMEEACPLRAQLLLARPATPRHLGLGCEVKPDEPPDRSRRVESRDGQARLRQLAPPSKLGEPLSKKESGLVGVLGRGDLAISDQGLMAPTAPLCPRTQIRVRAPVDPAEGRARFDLCRARAALSDSGHDEERFEATMYVPRKTARRRVKISEKIPKL